MAARAVTDASLIGGAHGRDGRRVITLTFRLLNGESVILVRGVYFRICADGTLRGPDNAVTARYSDGLWLLGRKQHRVLECREAVYLRVTSSDGQRECMGPYECLKVTAGAIFSNDTYLGAHARGESYLLESDIWREVALLPRQEVISA